jgi:hypothetical protein
VAVRLGDHRRVPEASRYGPDAIAVGLPLTWVATVPLSTFGGGLIAGAYFLTSGYLLTNQLLKRQTDQIVAPARA